MISIEVLVSRLPVGSSARMMAGSLTKALAMATFVSDRPTARWVCGACGRQVLLLQVPGQLFQSFIFAYAGIHQRQGYIFQCRHPR